MPEATHAIITGRVQGVGYRNWTVATAIQLGISGWVRNRSDGSVEAVFYGSMNQIETMLAACSKGPAMARVDNIQTSAYEQPLEAQGFTSKPTV
jgi:acylphosphatase